MVKSEYDIIVASPIDYNELVVEIWLNGEEIAILQMEEGKDRVKIEFFPEPIQNDILFDEFIEILKEAKRELMK